MRAKDFLDIDGMYRKAIELLGDKEVEWIFGAYYAEAELEDCVIKITHSRDKPPRWSMYLRHESRATVSVLFAQEDCGNELSAAYHLRSQLTSSRASLPPVEPSLFSGGSFNNSF